MKKFSKILVVVCMLATLIITAVACATTGTSGKDDQGRFIMSAPKISINTNVVTWEEVRYATEYGIVLNDDVDNEIVLDSKTNFVYDGSLGEATIKVRAIGDDEITVSSEYSNKVTYVPSPTLDTPQAPTATVVGTELVLAWTAVDGATSYNIVQSATEEGDDAIYSTTSNEYKINLVDISAAGVYAFTVRALSSDDNIINSGLSDVVRHITTEKIGDPVPKYGDIKDNMGSISWEKVENATHYVLFMSKNESEYKEVGRTTSTTWGSSSIIDDMEEFTGTKPEDEDDPWTDDSNGSYSFKVQAIHNSSASVYPNSDMVQVLLDSDDTVVANLTKPEAPDEVKLDGNKLTWNSVDDYKNYKILLKSGDETTSITVNDATSYDLTKHDAFTGNLAGKVFEISVQVNNSDDKYTLAGLTAAANSTYVHVNTEAPDKYDDGDSIYNGYFKVDSIGDLAYMMANPTGNYIFTEDIKGNNSNIYGGSGELKGNVIGNNKVIKDVDFIADKDNNINIFATIAEGSVIQDLTFSNVNIESEDGALNVALIANMNNGTISNIYFVKCNFNIAGRFSGLVGTNYGTMENIGLLYTSVNVLDEDHSQDVLYASGIVKDNHGTIFNASVIETFISINSPKPEEDEETYNITTTTRTYTAAGIALNNHKDITNSMVHESNINIAYYDKGYQTIAVAGGIVATNFRGTISESYVQGVNDRTKTVSIHAQVANTLSKDTAGGIVAIAESVTITSAYFASGVVSASDYAAGIIGLVKADGKVSISDVFTHSTKFIGQNKGYITSTDAVNIDTTNTYFLKSKAEDVDNYNTSNGVVKHASAFADLAKEGLNGFTSNTATYSEYPVLENMLYVEGDNKVINSEGKLDKRSYAVVYHGNVMVDRGDGVMSNLKEKGYFVDKFKLTIGEVGHEKVIILPIMNSVDGN